MGEAMKAWEVKRTQVHPQAARTVAKHGEFR